MRIWLVTIGEPWPIDGTNPRLHRTGTMARLYARGGDTVVWFNNTFDHCTKAHRFPASRTIEIEPNLTIVGLHGRPYTKNISLARIQHHRDVASDFKRLAQGLSVPDVIVASMPPLELSQAATVYGNEHRVPVDVDIRDLWPDIFLEVAPKGLKWAGRIALLPFYSMLSRSVHGAAAVSGVSESAVDWALRHASRTRSQFDGALPLAYSPDEISPDALQKAEAFWDKEGIISDPEALTICFFGSLTPRIELDTVMEAAKRIPAELAGKIRIVLCGTGALEQAVRDCAMQTPFLSYHGWVDAAQISALLRRSQVGLLPYQSSPDFVRAIPNKVFDYLAGGMPILTCLTGVTGVLVTKNHAGWLYRNGDADDLVRHLVELHRDREQLAAAAANSADIAKDYSAAKIYGAFRERLVAMIDAAEKTPGGVLSHR